MKSISAAETPPIFLSYPCWGRAYLHRLTRYALPSLLAPGNLPALGGRDRVTITILTDPVGESYLATHPVIGAVSEHAEIVYWTLNSTPGGANRFEKYMHQGGCYELTRQAAIGKGYAGFLSADAILSDGALSTWRAAMSSGVRVVAGYGPRISEEGFKRAAPAPKGVEPLTLTPRQMVQLLLSAPHPDFAYTMVSRTRFPADGALTIWPADDGSGFVARAPSLHAYLLDCRTLGSAEALSITGNSPFDSVYLPRLDLQRDDIAIVTESDDAIVLSLTPDADVEKSPADGSGPDIDPAKAIAAALKTAICEEPAIRASRRMILSEPLFYRAKDGDLSGALAASAEAIGGALGDTRPRKGRFSGLLNSRWFSRRTAERPRPPA